MGQLAVKSSGIQKKKAPAKTTEPKEFSLPKPKPAAGAIPDVIPMREKCKPVGLGAENSATFASREVRRIDCFTGASLHISASKRATEARGD